MQAKTTVRYQLTPVRMTTAGKKNVKKMWKIVTLVHCWWEGKMVQLL